MTTLKIRRMTGEPADLSLRPGAGELNHGGMILKINGNGPSVEVWISSTDRKAIVGLLK